MAYEFWIAPEDFDVNLLPPNARSVGSSEFKAAVNEYLTREFSGYGGKARIVVGDEMIGVTWDIDPKRFDAIEVAVAKLQRGQYKEGIQLLEMLQNGSPDDPAVLYNLGMALSDVGRLDRAVELLGRLAQVSPDNANGRVALGVALLRLGEVEKGAVELREALALEPKNTLALRNMGVCSMKLGDPGDAEKHLKRCVELDPKDQQSWYGLGKVMFAQGRREDADEYYRKAVGLDPSSEVAELARRGLSELAQNTFRSRTPGVERLDAVMYLLGALEKFEGMPKQEIQRIGFEVARLGMNGFDVNDSAQKYRLQSLPGQYSGLHMVSLMYAAFKIIEPSADVGFDLSKEYALASKMKEDKRTLP